jgi:signal transduction histidine kinase
MSVEDQTLDLLSHHAFPRLAAALEARSESVIHAWQVAVRQTLGAADELTFTELRNSLPEILREIVAALKSDKPAATQELVEGSRVHGEARFHENYNVRELVVEYRLLRRVIIEQVSQELRDRLDEGQSVALNMAIDTTIQSGIVTFTDYQREQIRASSEMQSKYLAFLSHDLRNHLNHATLVLELLTQRLAEIPECADSVEDVDSIKKSIFQTMEGMDRLLQAERLRKEAVEPKYELVDLQRVLDEVASRVAREAKDKGLAVEVQVPHGAAVRTDRALLVLVLQNLVGNAVKYSSHGRITMTAAAPANADDSGWVLSVSDEGPGIAPEYLGRLFEAFTRGQTHGQPGVGLGLSIASQAAKLLGTTLKVESQLGVGSTFLLEPRTAPMEKPA